MAIPFRVFILVLIILPVGANAEPLDSVGSIVPGLSCELRKLYRRNDVLTAKWTIVADESYSNARQHFHFKKENENCSYVVDEEKGIKYFPLTDKEGNPLASENDPYIISDTRINMWMKAAAPPTEVKMVSVVITGCEPFEAIEITDK